MQNRYFFSVCVAEARWNFVELTEKHNSDRRRGTHFFVCASYGILVAVTFNVS